MDHETNELRSLVVDEAQYLDQKNVRTGQRAEVFEWLRAAAENGNFHLVFCGDSSLANIIARYPQLQSRMIRPVVIQPPSQADIAALTQGTPFAAPKARHALDAVARLAGGLPNVENVLRIATAFCVWQRAS
ncbi:MAG: hypothetical protein ABJL67_15370 [Sulfitobacter sp.]